MVNGKLKLGKKKKEKALPLAESVSSSSQNSAAVAVSSFSLVGICFALIHQWLLLKGTCLGSVLVSFVCSRNW
ncbi:hypothetical protein Dimus_023250 [Dionaea muscipula]